MLHDLTCADVSNWPSPKYQDLVMIHLAAQFLRSFFCPVSMWQAHLQLHLCSLGCRCVAVWRGCYDRKMQETNVHYWCSNMFQLLYEKVLLPWYESSCCSTFPGNILTSSWSYWNLTRIVASQLVPQDWGTAAWPESSHVPRSNSHRHKVWSLTWCHLALLGEVWPFGMASGLFMVFQCVLCISPANFKSFLLCFCLSRGFRPRYPSIGKGSLQSLEDFGSLNLFWYVGTGQSILSAPLPCRSFCGAIRILLRWLLLHWTSGPVLHSSKLPGP